MMMISVFNLFDFITSTGKEKDPRVIELSKKYDTTSIRLGNKDATKLPNHMRKPETIDTSGSLYMNYSVSNAVGLKNLIMPNAVVEGVALRTNRDLTTISNLIECEYLYLLDLPKLQTVTDIKLCNRIILHGVNNLDLSFLSNIKNLQMLAVDAGFMDKVKQFVSESVIVYIYSKPS